MARPKKCTVDYFPHFATGSRRTIDVLEENYGNDGYALWFKLLEILAVTEGHCLDLNDQTDLEYFAAKAKVDVEKAVVILNHLARLKAIDRELWKYRVVWSQNFVDNLSDLYARRRMLLPQKPDLSEFMYAETTDSESLCMQKLQQEEIKEDLCTTETPKVNKSIVENSKVKESKKKNSKVNGVGVAQNDFSLVSKFYEENIGMLSGTVIEIINYYLDEDVEAELIIESMKIACMNNKRSMSYAEGALKNWLKDGIKTMERYKSSLIEKESIQNNLKQNGVNAKVAKFNNMYSRDWDFDEIEKLEQKFIDRKLEEDRIDRKSEGENET